MPFTRLACHFVQRLEARPRWLRWLEVSPPSVREADERARRGYVRYQLPSVAVLICAYEGAKYVGASSLVGIWFALAGTAALLWPAGILRLAVASHRAARAKVAVATRLRWLSVGLFALGTVSVVVLAALFALASVATFPGLLQWLP